MRENNGMVTGYRSEEGLAGGRGFMGSGHEMETRQQDDSKAGGSPGSDPCWDLGLAPD